MPVRATRGSAASARRRVASSPVAAAMASASSAGSCFGARPASAIATIVSTVRGPSASTQRRTAVAFSFVSARSVASYEPPSLPSMGQRWKRSQSSTGSLSPPAELRTWRASSGSCWGTTAAAAARPKRLRRYLPIGVLLSAGGYPCFRSTRAGRRPGMRGGGRPHPPPRRADQGQAQTTSPVGRRRAAHQDTARRRAGTVKAPRWGEGRDSNPQPAAKVGQ